MPTGSPNKPPFKIGDFVTTPFHQNDTFVVRRITKIEWTGASQTGWIADADGGELCPRCRRGANSVRHLDANWFILSEQKQTKKALSVKVIAKRLFRRAASV